MLTAALSLFLLLPQESRPAGDLLAEAEAKVETLSSPDALERGKAVDRLIEIGKPSAPALRAGLAAKEEEGRRLAVFVLGEIDTQEGAAELRKMLAGDPAERVRVEVAYALGKMKPKGVAPAFAGQLRYESSVKVLRALLVNLSNFHDPETVEPVLAFAEEKESDYLRRIAARTLQDLTGQMFRTDFAAWREWWTKYGAKFLEMSRQPASGRPQAPPPPPRGLKRATKS
ncbi:MAG TPA: HEAT repeat domain-containing protein [Planctomycetota bacterium]|jgi:HEAT repeat protein|nr:HEAT repeat domain-containing protein [Planctomycetota bacterium]